MWRRSADTVRALDREVSALVRERRRAPDLDSRTDVLSRLIRVDDGGDRLTDAELRDQMVTLLLAGHETTATGLAFAFDLLLRHPDTVGRLRDELASEDDDYLNAVVTESLRLRPVIDAAERMYLVDWEYAGMNDPMWDLGDLAVEAGFTAEQERALLAAYFDGAPPPAAVGRMVICKALCDLVWTLWGLIQVMNDNPVDDFWAYSLNRFERCRRLMGSAEFARAIEAVRAG